MRERLIDTEVGNMRYILILIVAYFTQVSALPDSTRYNALAEYFVMKNSFEFGIEDPYWNNEEWIRSNILRIQELLDQRKFDYKIKLLHHFEAFELITIIDHINLQLHGPQYGVFLIETSDFMEYWLLTQENLESVISENMSDYFSSDSGRTAVIEFFNSAYLYFKNHYRYEAAILSAKDIPAGVKKAIPYRINVFDKTGSVVTKTRLFRFHDINSGFEELSAIMYIFEGDQFYIEENLLLRTLKQDSTQQRVE